MAPLPRRVVERAVTRSNESDGWADADLAAIARVLQENTGLIFPPNRRQLAEAGMRRTMEQLGLDALELRRALAAPGDARDALVTELTVGETFFFREPGQLDFLRESVLPELRQRISGTRPLRIWSAGSATGEETYSLAMVLREAAWPWPAAILGTDLVPARLAAARRGRYTRWSMRGVPEPMIERYFVRQGVHFVLRDTIRRSAEFRVLNLAANDYPSARNGVVDMDVIFCRNVLIYFDPPNVEAIARRLLASLAPNGWLFLGASDPALADILPCEVVLTGAGLAYRPLAEGGSARRRVATWWLGDAGQDDERPPLQVRAAVEAAASARLSVEEKREQSIAAYDEAYGRGDYERASAAARVAIEGGDGAERAWTVLVRSLANRGNLEAAGEAAAAALDRHAMSAELSYLNGMLVAQSGRHADAAAAFKRALYLDARFAVAHLALGDALSASGDELGARRSYANAEVLLRADPAAVVAGADGVPAARLLDIARAHLQRLPQRRGRSPSRGVT